MINGIPVKIKVERQDNPEEFDIERPVFATARKHPKLKGCLKEIMKASVRQDVAERKAALVYERLREAANDDEIEAAGEAVVAATEAVENAGEELLRLVQEFVVEGFLGAGYPPDAANRYASYVPPERLSDLKATCLLGSGSLDFTNQAS